MRNLETLVRLVSVMPALRLVGGVLAACPVGYMPPDCKNCQQGYYGIKCASHCPATCTDRSCHPDTGVCYKCQVGFTGPKCSHGCQRGFYGQDCKKMCPLNCFNNVCSRFTGYCETCVEGYAGVMCERQSSLPNSSVQSRGTGGRAANKVRQTTDGHIVIYVVAVIISCIWPALVVYSCLKVSIRNLRQARPPSHQLIEPSQAPISTVSNLRRPHRQAKKYLKMDAIEEESAIHEVPVDRNDFHVHFEEPSGNYYSSFGRKKADGQPIQLDLVNEALHSGVAHGSFEPDSIYNGLFGTSELNRNNETSLLQLNEGTQQWDNCSKLLPSGQVTSNASVAKETVTSKDHKRRPSSLRLLREKEQHLLGGQKFDENWKNIGCELSPGAYTIHNGSSEICGDSSHVFKNKCRNSMEAYEQSSTSEQTQDWADQHPGHPQHDLFRADLGDVVGSGYPSVREHDVSIQGNISEVTTSLPVIDQVQNTKIYEDTNQLLNEENSSSDKQVSKIDRFMELLNLKRMLNVSMETRLPSVHSHLDSNYNDHRENGMNQDIISAQVKCEMPEKVKSFDGQSYSLNVVPELKEAGMPIDGFRCKGFRMSVSEDDMYKRINRKQTGHAITIPSPANCSTLYDGNSCQSSIAMKIRNQDVKGCTLDVSALEAYGYSRLIFRTHANCATDDGDLFPDDVHMDVISSTRDSHMEEHQLHVTDPAQETVLCTEQAHNPNNCPLINGTANNTNSLQLRTSSEQQPSFTVTSSTCFPDPPVLCHQICSSDCQHMTIPLSQDNVTGTNPFPLLSITNCTPMKLSISYCLNEGACQRLASVRQPIEQSSAPSAFKTDSVIANSFHPTEISLLLSSPPKCCQSQEFSAMSTTSSINNINYQKQTNQKRDLRVERLSTCRTDIRPECTSHSRNKNRFRGFISPSKAISRLRERGSSSTTKCKTDPNKCRKYHLISSHKCLSTENRNDRGMPAFQFIPVPHVTGTNHQRKHVEPESQEIFIHRNAIRMTVNKSPIREVVATFPTSSEGRTVGMSSRSVAHTGSMSSRSVAHTGQGEFQHRNILSGNECNKDKYGRFDIVKVGSTERFLKRQNTIYSKEHSLTTSDQQCQDDNVSIRTRAVRSQSCLYRPSNPGKGNTGECLLEDIRYLKQRISQITSNSKKNNSTEMGFRLNDGGRIREMSSGNESKSGKTDRCPAHLKADTENVMQKTGRFQIHKHTPVMDERSILKFRLREKLKELTLTNEVRPNIHRVERASQTEVKGQETMTCTPLKHQSDRPVQSQTSDTGPRAVSHSSPTRQTENSAQISVSTSTDQQKNLSPPRDHILQQKNALSVYPLPSILEEVAMSESTETESSEIKSCSQDGDEDSVKRHIHESEEMNSNEHVHSTWKYKMLRHNPCRGNTEIWKAKYHESGKRRHRSSTNLHQEGRQNASEYLPQSNKSLKPRYSQRLDEDSRKSSISQDSEREHKIPNERRFRGRRQATESYSTTEEVCEFFYDAVEHLASASAMTQTPRRHGYNQCSRKVSKDVKPGIQFARSSSKNADCSSNKKNDGAAIVMLSSRKDTKYQTVNRDEAKATKSECHIAFRFASRSKTDVDVSNATGRAAIRTSGMGRRSDGRKAPSKHWNSEERTEVIRQSHNLTYTEVAASTNERTSVSDYHPQKTHCLKQTHDLGNSCVPKYEDRDATIYDSLHSENDNSFGNVQCSAGSDFFSTRDM